MIECAASGCGVSKSGEKNTDRAKIMILIGSDRIGSGDDELGAKLMINFIRTLDELGPELWRLVLINNGVKLAVTDSPVYDDLIALQQKGRTILSCGTCLAHFGLSDAEKAGETTNMVDIVTAMQLADKVISP